MNRKVVFLFNLLQDVNILRPLVRLAASNSENDIILCISEKFIQRDNALVWSKELGELAGAQTAPREYSPRTRRGVCQRRCNLLQRVVQSKV